MFDTRLRFKLKRRGLGEVINQLRKLTFAQLKEKVKERVTNTFFKREKSKAEVIQKTTNYQPYEAKPYKGNVIFLEYLIKVTVRFLKYLIKAS
jgi:hypothetical protein